MYRGRKHSYIKIYSHFPLSTTFLLLLFRHAWTVTGYAPRALCHYAICVRSECCWFFANICWSKAQRPQIKSYLHYFASPWQHLEQHACHLEMWNVRRFWLIVVLLPSLEPVTRGTDICLCFHNAYTSVIIYSGSFQEIFEFAEGISTILRKLGCWTKPNGQKQTEHSMYTHTHTHNEKCPRQPQQ